MFALTGNAKRNPVNWGAKSCNVSLDINGIELNRKMTQSGAKEFDVDGSVKGVNFTGTPKEKQSQLMEFLGVTESQIEAVLETGRFAEMDDTQRKAVIFKALNISVTPDALAKWLKKHEGSINWDFVIETQLKGYDLNDDSLQKVFVERRRNAKRQLSDLSAEMDRFLNLPNVDIKLRGKAEEKLAGLKAELETLLKQSGEASTLHRVITEFEAVKAELNKPDNSDRITGLTYDLGILAPEMEALEAHLYILKEKIAAEKGIVSGIGEFVEIGDECDRCNQKVTKTLAKKLASDHKKRIAMHERVIKDTTEQLQGVEKDITELRQKITGLQSEIKSLEAGNYKGDRKLLEKRYDELLAEKKRLETLAVNPEEINTLRGRITNGEAMLANMDLVERADSRKAEIEENVASLQQQVTIADALEKAYSPKGVKAELLRQAIDRVEVVANDFLKPVGLGNLKIETLINDKEVFELTVGGKPENSFSRAQRHAIGISIQAVLSILTGLKILAVDDVDIFVGTTKSVVNQLIFSNLAKFDTVLIFKAEAVKPAPLNMPNAAMYWLNGKMEVVSKNANQ